MLTRHLGRAALESIAFQSTDFFDAITEAFQKLKDAKSPPATNDIHSKPMIEWTAQADIPKIVEKYTGLNIDFQCAASSIAPAYTMLPDIDRNHPLMDDFRRGFWTNKDSKREFKKEKEALVGAIDLKAGKVSGLYTKIESPIFIGSEMIRGSTYTAEEIAAVFLHEVGHLMTYYEYLGRSLLLTHVLGDLSKDFKGASTQSQKVEILRVVKRELELDDIDEGVIESNTSAESFISLVVSQYATTRRSATGSAMFDHRTTEALADQYVSRLGGGKHLVTGLDKLFRMYGSKAYQDTKTIAFGRLFKVAFAILLTILLLPLAIAFIIGMLFMMMTSHPSDEYDEPKVRMDRVKQDYLQAMKRPNVTKEQRKSLQEDYDAIEKVLEDVNYEKSFFTYVWTTIFPKARKQAKLDKELQQLERLANNELFGKFNKLKTLS